MKIKVNIERDSVCAADDLQSHNKVNRFSIDEPIFNILSRIKNDYLPRNISGGKATWLIHINSSPIAIIAQEWDLPRIIIKSENIIRSYLKDKNEVEIYCEYLAQKNPELAYNEIKNN